MQYQQLYLSWRKLPLFTVGFASVDTVGHNSRVRLWSPHNCWWKLIRFEGWLMAACYRPILTWIRHQFHIAANLNGWNTVSGQSNVCARSSECGTIHTLDEWVCVFGWLYSDRNRFRWKQYAIFDSFPNIGFGREFYIYFRFYANTFLNFI